MAATVSSASVTIGLIHCSALTGELLNGLAGKEANTAGGYAGYLKNSAPS